MFPLGRATPKRVATRLAAPSAATTRYCKPGQGGPLFGDMTPSFCLGHGDSRCLMVPCKIDDTWPCCRRDYLIAPGALANDSDWLPSRQPESFRAYVNGQVPRIRSGFHSDVKGEQPNCGRLEETLCWKLEPPFHLLKKRREHDVLVIYLISSINHLKP